MKPFQKHLAIAIDGGGIRGVIVTKALSMLEDYLGYPLNKTIELAAGTSTGSIIAAGLASGLDAKTLHQLYIELGDQIFCRSLSSTFWPLFNHRYSQKPLEDSLLKYFGNKMVADLWKAERPVNLIITTFDILENRTRFIKPYKSKYEDWPLVKAVRASSAAPTYFESVDGQFIDGGIGSYNNPCYLVAYEAIFSQLWNPEETTLLSLGTGRDPNTIKKGEADRFTPLSYIKPLLDAFTDSAADQQVDVVQKMFPNLDFRRFQVDLQPAIDLDDVSQIPALIRFGEQLGQSILDDNFDRAMNIVADHIPNMGGVRLTAEH